MLLNEVINEVYCFKEFITHATELLKQFEETVKADAIPIFFGIHRYINAAAVDSIYEALRELKPEGDVAVILFSSGGDVDEAYLIAKLLQTLPKGKLTTYIPRYAKSSATLIACASDEIVMLPPAELGPIDPVLYDPKTNKYIPLQSILEIIDIITKKNIPREALKEFIDRLPVIELGDYKRAVEHVTELATKLLTKRMYKSNPEKAKQIAQKLVSYKQHGAAITIEDAKEIGLNTRKPTPREEEILWKLHKLWYQHIIEAEYIFKETNPEPIDFKLWKGTIHTITPQEIIERIRQK